MVTTIQTRSKEQSKKLFTLLGKLKLDPEDRQEMIYNITLGRTKSSKDLSVSEADRLITELSKRVNYDPGQQMRRKIYSIAHEMHWHIPGSTNVDKQRLNAWLIKYGYMHKPLMEYLPEQLPTLVTQLENYLKSSYESKEKNPGKA